MDILTRKKPYTMYKIFYLESILAFLVLKSARYNSLIHISYAILFPQPFKTKALLLN